MKRYLILLLLCFSFFTPTNGRFTIVPYSSSGDALSWVNGTDTLVTFGWTFPVSLWNASVKGEPLNVIPDRWINGTRPSGYDRTFVDVDQNGTSAIVATSTSDIFRWRFSTQVVERLIVINNTDVNAISLGDYVYVGTNQSAEILVYDMDAHALIERMAFGSSIWALDATNQGNLAIGFQNGTLSIRANNSWQAYQFENPIQKTKWNGDELFVLEGKQLHILTNNTLEDYSFPRQLLSVAPSDNGKMVAVGDDNGTVTILDRKGNVLKELLFPAGEFMPEIISLDWNGNRLAIGKKTIGIPIVDTTTWQRIRTLGIDPDTDKYVIVESPPEPAPFPLLFFLSSFVAMIIFKKRKKVV
ncbi:MAG: hypothetical protein D6732_08990 [Methanobacteriota archaeon]|nr:MAG: hypothetical protein D6732_08990 [Euryarchaeota archaeon]